MSDLSFPSLNTVTLVGRVKRRWDPSSERAPLKLVVETYKVLKDGRKIPRTDVVVLWGEFLKGKAQGAGEGSIVSLTASIDSSKDKDGNWKDELRCETFGPVSGGVRSSVPSQPTGGRGGGWNGGGQLPYNEDEEIPFAPPGLF